MQTKIKILLFLLFTVFAVQAQNIRQDQIRNLPDTLEYFRINIGTADTTHYADTEKLLGDSWSVFYSDGSGNVQDLGVGGSGTVLKSNGASSAPSWQTDATGSGGSAYTDSIVINNRHVPGDSLYTILQIETVIGDSTSAIRGDMLIGSDSTAFRTFSDLKYKADGTYLIPSDSTSFRTFSDLKYSTSDTDSATVSSLISDSLSANNWNHLVGSDTTAFRTFSNLKYKADGTYLIPSDSTSFRTFSDAKYSGAQDFADVLGADPDGGDIDQTSLGKLEFYDAGLYIDADADGVMDISSDGTLELHSADWDISVTGALTNMSGSNSQWGNDESYVKIGEVEDSINAYINDSLLTVSGVGYFPYGKYVDGVLSWVENTDPPADGEFMSWQASDSTYVFGAGSGLTQEEVDDYVDALINDGDAVHTRITITYDDTDNAMDFVVDDPDTAGFRTFSDLKYGLITDTTEFRTASDIYYQPIDSDLDNPDIALSLLQDSLTVKLNRSEANSIDSDQYVDGSIDKVHLATNTTSITTKITSSSYTIGTTDVKESYGGVIYVTGAATITLPAVVSGMSFTIITVGAYAVSVDPNVSDLMYLDGTALDDGDQATNTSTTGDLIVITYYDATGWYAASGSNDGDLWTDGG